MMLTLFVDASYCPRTHAAGYGAWAKRDGWKQGTTFGGRLGSGFLQSHEAELAAIATALVYLHENGHLDEVETVLVQSDCMRALELLVAKAGARITNHRKAATVERRKMAVASPAERRAIEVIRDASPRLLMVRHVRGHSTGSTRQGVNNLCDRIAGVHMRRARDGGATQ